MLACQKMIKIFFLSLFVFIGSMVYQSFAMEDAIIAVVNDELITLKDLKDYIRTTYVSLVAEGLPDEQLKSVMGDLQENGINKLIEDKLILSKANDIGIIVQNKIINERLMQIKQKYSSEQDFLDGLIKNGATVTDLRNKILNQLKIKFIVDHFVKSKIYIAPQEVTDFYHQNTNQFKKNEKINLDSIFISFKDGNESAQQRAQEAMHLIDSGKNFREVAQQFSDTPSIGFIEKGQMIPDIENIVFNLKIEDISSLIQVDNGIFIFQLLGKSPEQNASLEEVKDQIVQLLERQKFQQKIIEWLNKLKKEAYIEIKR